MISDFIPHATHFLAQYVTRDDGIIYFEEKNAAGAGKAYFQVIEDCVVLRPQNNSHVIMWSSNRKCADGAFFTEDDGHTTLHIVELKSKLTAGEWVKVKEQIGGMLIYALAVLGVVGRFERPNVVSYVAYSDDALTASLAANPVLNKTLVGGDRTLGASEEWERGVFDLPLDYRAKLIKGQREKGTVDFGIV